MLVEITEWLIDSTVKVWNMFLYDGGYIGMFIILIPIIRKLSNVMRQFTN